MTASPLMMWYKMANKDSAMCGPYSMGNFCPHSCCTAKKAFCRDNMYLTVNLWIVYVSLSKRPFAKRCKLNHACRLYNSVIRLSGNSHFQSSSETQRQPIRQDSLLIFHSAEITVLYSPCQMICLCIPEDDFFFFFSLTFSHQGARPWNLTFWVLTRNLIGSKGTKTSAVDVAGRLCGESNKVSEFASLLTRVNHESSSSWAPAENNKNSYWLKPSTTM